MTRPIYEPSLERTDAALGYDKNQLQRRPVPPTPASLAPVSNIMAAPHIMAGVNDSDYEDAGVPGFFGFSLWPGGLVCQALLPFAVGPTLNTGDFHQLLSSDMTALVDQVAANKAAAAVCFSFTAEEAGIDTDVYVYPRTEPPVEYTPHYMALLAIKLNGTPRNIGISLSRDSQPDSDFTISSASTRWGNDYFGLFEMDFGVNADPYLPGEQVDLKMWADGAGAEIHLAFIYWVPKLGGPFMSDTVGHWEQFIGFDQYLSATATSVADSGLENISNALADTQYLDGGPFLDPAYALSCGGDGFSIGIGQGTLQGIYDNAFEFAQLWEPRHMYQCARINVSNPPDYSVGYALLYKDLFPFEQVPIHSRDWGLAYFGPWNHAYQNLHWGLWAPQDITNGGTYFTDARLDDANFVDVRVGEMWFPRDVLTRPIRYVQWP